MTTSPYTSLYRGFLHICEFLGSIPSHHQPQYAEVPFWNNIKTPLPKHTWEVHIIAVWITEGRNCLDACNKSWLKELAKETAETKWEINYIHNDPYPSALSTEETLGLYKIRKLPNDLCQTPQVPQDKDSTLDPPQSLTKSSNQTCSVNTRWAGLDLH